MNLGKILSIISQNNINPDDVFALVERIQNLDLQDEYNLRKVIRDASKLANKKLTKMQEDELVNRILTEGISEEIFNLF
ncbi:MAG TPA: stage VI sporulation protein F [Bacilli bacterium]|nr:stage VI sporulation protein F [Bacilli bacterium]HPT89478.1 stage VI sporulation protein F [Bacilli bacterium]HQD92233.1 stage VI sporulation protein F [Bacilli bacterium]